MRKEEKWASSEGEDAEPTGPMPDNRPGQRPGTVLAEILKALLTYGTSH